MNHGSCKLVTMETIYGYADAWHAPCTPNIDLVFIQKAQGYLGVTNANGFVNA